MRNEKKKIVAEKVAPIANAAMRAWAPPAEEAQRLLMDFYAAGSLVQERYRRTGDLCDILKPWGEVLNRFQKIVDFVVANPSPALGLMVLNRADEYWDFDLKPVWSAILRQSGAE